MAREKKRYGGKKVCDREGRTTSIFNAGLPQCGISGLSKNIKRLVQKRSKASAEQAIPQTSVVQVKAHPFPTSCQKIAW